MPRVYRIDTDTNIGEISDEVLAQIVKQLEDEHAQDDEYFIDRETLELLSDNNIDPEVVAKLEKALGDDDDMTIAWE